MITHYLPQLLLKRFGRPVYELDIYTGSVEPRTIRKAGSGEDLWPEDIEKNLMGVHDNDAARVFRYCIDEKRRIVLSDRERRTLAFWLALFMPRVPNTSDDAKQRIQDLRDNPEMAIDILYQRRREVLAIVRRDNPQEYEAIIADLGQYAGEAWILATVANSVRDGRVNYLADPNALYQRHLRTVHEGMPKLAGILCNYHWTWLFSPHGFVIGDNPLVRWHEPTQTCNYAIGANLEITMPLSTNLCLRMRRRKVTDHGQIMYCPRRDAIEYNRRQRLAATAHVYGSEPKLLNSIAPAAIK